MPSAADQTDEVVARVLAATSEPTVRPRKVSGRTTMPSSVTTDAILSSDESGSSDTDSGSGSESQTSSSSGLRSRTSKRRWRQPRNVREFATQANAVATLVLNGEMDIDAARQYSSVARTIAQAMSIEVTRARFLKAMPDLEFGDEVWEDT